MLKPARRTVLIRSLQSSGINIIPHHWDALPSRGLCRPTQRLGARIEDEGGTTPLCPAQAKHRTRIRHHQVRTRLSSVLPARPEKGHGGMDPGLPRVESKAHGRIAPTVENKGKSRAFRQKPADFSLPTPISAARLGQGRQATSEFLAPIRSDSILFGPVASWGKQVPPHRLRIIKLSQAADLKKEKPSETRLFSCFLVNA